MAKKNNLVANSLKKSKSKTVSTILAGTSTSKILAELKKREKRDEVESKPKEYHRANNYNANGARTVTPTIGKNLASVLSKSLVRDPYAAVSEIVCNSYDADAHVVRITASPLENRLIVQDDGEGMSVEGLTNFFRLGDSVKVDNPISPGGRRRIGKFGIATVLLEYLSKSYKVESVNGKTINTVEDTLTGDELSVQTEKARKGAKSGTTITLSDFNFSMEKKEFDPVKLRERLRWDIPNVPDFDVYVNDSLVRKRGVIEYSSVYEVDTKIGGQPLKGRLYFQNTRGNTSDKLSGVRVYVDGRAVGDPTLFRAHEIDERLDKGLLGMVHADFLRESITLDRGQFQEHDRRVGKVVEAVREVMRGIVSDLEQGKSRRGYYEQDKVFSHVQENLDAAQYIINERLGRNEQNALTIKLDSGKNSGKIARFDKKQRIIFMNAENPMLVLLPRFQGRSQVLADSYLQRAFIATAAHALTNHELESSSNGLVSAYDSAVRDAAGDLFGKYTQLATQISKFIDGERIVDTREIPWCKFRLYDHFELANLTGRHPNVFRYILTSGAVNGTEDNYFRAREVIPVIEKINGYVPCIQVVEPKFSIRDRQGGAYKIHYTHRKPSELDVRMKTKDFKDLGVINIGIYHPYHFVPSENMDSFAQRVKEADLYTSS